VNSGEGTDRPPDGRGPPVAEAQREQGQSQAQPEGGAQPGPTRDQADEVARMEDRWKRALADLDNYRKRSVRETGRRVTEVSDTLNRSWFEALDSVDRALAGMQPENPMFEGLRAVLEQMEAILARQGIERVGAPGERFDPERHEAIGVRAADDVPDQTILEVARSGFAQGDRVLRPAQVIVSRAPSGSP
jgi:molecular chaperone GrpE